MYLAYDFTFAGISASEYGLSVCDIDNKKHSANAFGNVANIVEERVAGRIQPLHFGVKYHEKPLTFNLIFAAEKYLDRYDMQRVSMWLTGHQQYQWLTIHQPDMMHMRFRCLIQKLTPIHVGWYPIAFEAEVVCDCPYAYGKEFETELGSGVFYNESTCREPLRPKLEITVPSGCAKFSILNSTTGKTFSFGAATPLPGGAMTITVDNENCIIEATQTGGTLSGIYDYFDFSNGFFELVPGKNDLVISAQDEEEKDLVTAVKMTGRFLYNVGA